MTDTTPLLIEAVPGPDHNGKCGASAGLTVRQLPVLPRKLALSHFYFFNLMRKISNSRSGVAYHPLQKNSQTIKMTALTDRLFLSSAGERWCVW